MTTQRATVEDVARLAHVSAKTVSRVFSQRELVSPDTAERVLVAAKRLKFRPNALARGLRRGGRTRTMGLIIGELGNPFYYKVASGIERTLREAGYGLILATTDDTEEGEEKVAETLLAQRIDALLLIPVGRDQSYLEGERQLGTAVVAIDRPARNLVADSVVLANRSGVAEATSGLVSRGHRRIAYVCNPATVYSQEERLSGFHSVLHSAGLDTDPRWEVLEDDMSIPPERLVGQLLDCAEPPTAIIAGNNRMTVGALRALRARGDESTALIGFDDFDTADLMGVTVVSYEPVELGRRAAELAVERIDDPTGLSRQIELPTYLVERGTGERPAR